MTTNPILRKWVQYLPWKPFIFNIYSCFFLCLFLKLSLFQSSWHSFLFLKAIAISLPLLFYIVFKIDKKIKRTIKKRTDEPSVTNQYKKLSNEGKSDIFCFRNFTLLIFSITAASGFFYDLPCFYSSIWFGRSAGTFWGTNLTTISTTS